MKFFLSAFFFYIAVICAPNASLAQDAAPTPEVQQVIDILEDPDSLAALIDGLRQVTDSAAAPPPEEETPITRFIAETTTEAAQAVASTAFGLWDRIVNAPDAFASLSTDQIDLLWEALRALALVIVTTSALYLALRLVFRRTIRRLGANAQEAGILRSVALLLGVTLIDVLIVLLAWGAGYLAALFFYGQAGEIGVRQSLYLNAFLIVGLTRVVLRAIFSPDMEALRFIDVSTPAARIMARWFGVIASVLGYGQLLIVPIVARQASMEAGRGISTLLALVAILIAVWLTLRHRRAVASWMLSAEAESRPGVRRFLARRWHVPVLIYLFALFLIVAARPDGLIWPVLVSSAQVIGILVAGGFVSGLITRYIAHGVHLPRAITARLPTLEERLNAFVPKALFLLRALVIFGVALFALSAMGLFDLATWAAGEGGRHLTSTAVSVAIMLLVGFGLWLALVSWVDYRLNPDYGSVPTARENTLLSLLRNAASILLMVIVLMFVLSELGVDIAPLIASAGVFGLAIGFGAQKLVQDIITGIFIQVENMMNVGDVVTLGGTTGVVEKLTIRTVSLRDVHGVFHVIPFSSVDMVSNYVKDYGNFVADIGIAYRENVQDGKDAMLAAFEELKGTDVGEHIRGDIEWFGVQSLGDSAVVLRARIKCAAGQQWGVGRAFNEICKRVMDERGIEIPFPHQTLYFGENKDGSAPALHVARSDPA